MIYPAGSHHDAKPTKGRPEPGLEGPDVRYPQPPRTTHKLTCPQCAQGFRVTPPAPPGPVPCFDCVWRTAQAIKQSRQRDTHPNNLVTREIAR